MLLLLLLLTSVGASECHPTGGYGEIVNGTCTVQYCFEGYGVGDGDCHRCAVGMYSDIDDLLPCVPCTNGPDNAIYLHSGAITPRCSFKCPENRWGARCTRMWLITFLVIMVAGAALFGVAIHTHIQSVRARKQR